MSNSRTTRAIEPQAQVSGKNSARGGVSLGKKALSVLMSVVLVMGLNPGFAVANTGSGGTTAGTISTQAVVTASFDLNYTGAPAYTPTLHPDSTKQWSEYTWPVPTREGYTFDGWALSSEESATAVVSGTGEGTTATIDQSADFTLYAKWTAKTSTVKFNKNAPEGANVADPSPAQTTVTYGQTYGLGTELSGKLPIPTDSSNKYAFVGWFTEKAEGTQIQAGTTVSITENQILYAHWTDATYALVFNVNETGATVSPGSKTLAFGSEYGELPTPVKSGREFVGWFDDATAGNLVDSTTKLTTANSDKTTTIYAHWSDPTIEVTLNPNGGTIETGKVVVPVGGTPAHTFADAKAKLTDATTIGIATDKVGLEAADSTNYTFGGWYASPSPKASDTPVSDTTNATTSSPRTLYAKWNPKTADITLDLEYTPETGTKTSTVTVTYNSAYVNATHEGKVVGLGTPTRPGYTFDGWFTAATDGDQVIEGDIVKDVTSSITLHAHWTANTYTASLNLQGGELKDGDPTELEVTVGEDYGTLPEPEKAGYTFLGWFYNAEGTTPSTKLESTTKAPAPSSSNTTLYAKWSDLTNYTIYYALTGGAEISGHNILSSQKTYKMGSSVTLPTADNVRRAIPDTNPQQYYEFVGWHEASDLSDAALTGTTPTNWSGDKVLYAEWAGTTDNRLYTVTFDTDGGTDVQPQQIAAGGKIDASAIKHVKINAESKVVTLEDVSKEGYTLASGKEWTLNGSVYNVSSATINANTALKANWQGMSIGVTFVNNDDTSASTEVSGFTYGSAYGALSTLTRAGYVFDGWWTKGGADDEWGDRITNTSTVEFKDSTAANNKLYAKWNPNSYAITLDLQGGTLKPGYETSFSVTSGDKWEDTDLALEAGSITKEGYEFEGWYVGRLTGTKVVGTDKVEGLTGSTTLVANWTAKKVKVYYHNYSTAVNTWVAEPTASEVDFGSKYAPPAVSLTTDEATKYTADGWYTAQVGGTKVTSSDTVDTTDDVHLYARAAGNSTMVTLNSNNGAASTITTVRVTYGEDYSFADPAPVTGKKFVGWFNEQTGGTQTASDGTWTPTTFTYTPTRYAHWEDTKYNVTLFTGIATAKDAATALADFDATAADGANSYKTKSDKKASSAQAYALPTIENDNYTFDGWYTTPKFTTGSAITSIPAGTEEDQVVYAKWTPNASSTKLLTLSFDVQGGTPIPSIQKVAADGKATFDISSYAAPTREGYTFVKWHQDIPNGNDVTASASYEITKDTTLVAEWRASSFKVTLDATSGAKLPTGAEAEITATNGETYADAYYGEGVSKTKTGLPTPTKDGYTFAGWFTSDKEYTNEDTVDLTAALSLTAKWDPAVYTITYEANGGTVSPATATVIPQADGTVWATSRKSTVLPTPTRDNYVFAGWCVEEDLSDTAPLAAGLAYTPTLTEDATLYAKWTAKSFNLDLDLDGGYMGKGSDGVTLYNPKTYTVETDTFSLQSPEKQGYDFSGWIDQNSDSDTLLTSVTIAKGSTGDKAYKAVYAPKSFRITFVEDNGAEISSKTYAYNTLKNDIEIPEMTTRVVDGKDYPFDGWDPIVTDVVGDVTYKAKRHDGGAHVLKIEYDKDSLLGSTAPLDTSYTAIETKTLTDAAKTGYKFTGFYLKDDVVAPEKSGDPYTPKDGAKAISKLVGALGVDYTGDNKLYATWELTSYKITYELFVGENAESNPASFTSADAKITLADPSKDGYKFLGWFTTYNGEATPPTFNGQVKTIDPSSSSDQHAFTLYAKWQAKLVSIAEIPDQYAATGGVEPTLYVYDADGKTVASTNYTAVFTNNMTAGQASVTVTGKGDYAGSTLTATFNVVDLPTDATALKAEIAKVQALVDATKQADTAAEKDALANGDYYAGKTDLDTIKNAIIAATNVSNNVNPTADQIKRAASNLAAYVNGGSLVNVTTNADEGNVAAADSFAAKRLLNTVDTDELAKALAEAEADIAKYAESTDGTDVPKKDADGNDQKWLTPTEMKAYQDVIDAAKAVLDDETSSKKAVADAAEALGKAKTDASDATSGTDRNGTKKTVYTFTFYTNGGLFEDGTDSYSVEVTEGEKVPEPTMKLTREGSNFDYWTWSNLTTKFNFDQVQTDDTVNHETEIGLFAHWSPIDYTIRYELNGASWKTGKAPSTDDLKYDTTTGKATLKAAADLQAPTAEGYTFEFIGWFDTADFSGDAVLSIPAGTTGNKVFYAQWKKTKIDSADGTTHTEGDVTLTSDALASDKLPEGEEIRFDVFDQSSDTAKVNAAAAAAEAGDASAKAKIDAADATFLFDVDLKVVKSSNTSQVDDEATAELKGALAESPLTLEFYVGAKYAGRAATVYHVHDGALAEAKEATVTEDGHVSIQVTQLSEFLIAVEPGEGPEPGDAVTVWRLYNPNSGEHLFTTDKGEYDDLQTVGWNGEGEAWKAPKASSTPIYRVYNPNNKWGDHHYTADKEEVDFLVNAGWQQDDFEMYSDDAQGLDIYCLYNPNAEPMGYSGTHHYTSDKGEYDDLDAIGWQGEGVKFYGLA